MHKRTYKRTRHLSSAYIHTHVSQARAENGGSFNFNFLFNIVQVVSPLLHERDMYLAWSLKRSKAVNGSRAVVGVVGKGHLRGVLYHLVTPDSSGLRFRDLIGSKVSQVLRLTRP